MILLTSKLLQFPAVQYLIMQQMVPLAWHFNLELHFSIFKAKVGEFN